MRQIKAESTIRRRIAQAVKEATKRATLFEKRRCADIAYAAWRHYPESVWPDKAGPEDVITPERAAAIMARHLARNIGTEILKPEAK